VEVAPLVVLEAGVAIVPPDAETDPDAALVALSVVPDEVVEDEEDEEDVDDVVLELAVEVTVELMVN